MKDLTARFRPCWAGPFFFSPAAQPADRIQETSTHCQGERAYPHPSEPAALEAARCAVPMMRDYLKIPRPRRVKDAFGARWLVLGRSILNTLLGGDRKPRISQLFAEGR